MPDETPVVEIVDAELKQSNWSGVTPANIGDFLDEVITGKETLIAKMILKAEDDISSGAGRNFKIANTIYEETLDAGTDKLYTSNSPINEVQKITVNGNDVFIKDGSNNTLNLGVEFLVYPKYVFFRNGIYSPNGFDEQAVKIQYTLKKFWGEDVVGAIIEAVAKTYLQKEYGNKDVSQMDTGTITVGFNQESRGILEKIVEKYTLPCV